jgi:hypothetical protein
MGMAHPREPWLVRRDAFALMVWPFKLAWRHHQPQGWEVRA